MLVKHNYYPNYQVELKASESNINYVKFSFNDMNLIDGKNYTLSFFSKQSPNGSGKFNIYFIQDDYKRFEKNITQKANEKAIISFLYEKSRKPVMHIYSDINLHTANIGNLFYAIKLEDGDNSNLYLPNINTLPKEKQPLLPPEGNYKEIQPM